MNAKEKSTILHICLFAMIFSITSTIVSAQQTPKTVTTNIKKIKTVKNNSKTITKSNSIQNPQKGLTVILDAGHGGTNKGAYHYGVAEKDINLAFVKLLKSDLESQGFKVILTRETDKEIPLDERVELLNKLQGDIIISIHHNASVYKYKDGN